MFDLAEKRLVWIPVRWKGVKQVSPDTVAESCEHEIQLQVEILDNERLREVFAEADEDDTAQEAKAAAKAAPLSELERFKAVVHDWRNIIMGGQPAEFSDANIKRLLKFPMFAIGFDTSYLRAWSGQIELAEKNSASSSSSGQPGAGGQQTKRTKRSSGKRKR